jgi:hypothetical protein
MRATIDDRCLPKSNQTINFDSAINYNVTAILRYEGAQTTDPKSTAYTDPIDACLSLNQDLLKTLEPQQIPPVTDRILLNITFRPDDTNVTRSFINNSSYVVDDFHPTLEKFVSEGVPVNEFPSNQNIYSYDRPGAVDITILSKS